MATKKRGKKAAKKGAKKGAKAAAALAPTAFLQFTRSGVPVGPAIPAPPGANDLHLFWRLVAPRVIIRARWTRSGVPIPLAIPVPPGANDAHIKIV